MPYTVEFLPNALKALAALPSKQRRQVAASIDALQLDPRPHGATKLHGASELWRTRAGNYRVIYTINDGILTVLVIKIGHRSTVYRR